MLNLVALDKLLLKLKSASDLDKMEKLFRRQVVVKRLLNLVLTPAKVNRKFKEPLSKTETKHSRFATKSNAPYRFGVSYHGAAQSASGTKEQVATYREQNRELFNSISQFGNNEA